MNDLLLDINENIINSSDGNNIELISPNEFDDISNKSNDVMLTANMELGIETSENISNIQKEIYDFSKVKKPYREEMFIPLSEVVLIKND